MVDTYSLGGQMPPLGFPCTCDEKACCANTFTSAFDTEGLLLSEKGTPLNEN